MRPKKVSLAVTRTPYRLCLAGCTDLPPYVKKYGGDGLSGTIDKYVTVVVKRRLDSKVLFHYFGGTEEAASVKEVAHPYVRVALGRVGIKDGLDVAAFSDILPGSGLGSSGAFTVGLLNAFWALEGKNKSPKVLAEEASDLEINTLKAPIGKHDQYITAFGGIRSLKFKKNGEVEVKRIKIPISVKNKFENQALLVYSGITRSASQVLSSTANELKNLDSRTVSAMHEFRKIGNEMQTSFASSDFYGFGKKLSRLWEAKKRAFTISSNERVDELIKSALGAGVLGGKAVGAGGGGFLYFVCPDAKIKKQVAARLSLLGAVEYPFSFTEHGSKIVAVFS